MSAIKIKDLGNFQTELVIDDIKKIRRMIPLVDKLVKEGQTIVLTTDLSVDDFILEVGKYFGRNEKNLAGDDNAFQILGITTLDFYIPEVFFIKSTLDKKVYEFKKGNHDAKN